MRAGIARPATYDHVIWIWFENQAASSVIGNANAPYMNSVVTACGHGTAWKDIVLDTLSEPNYIAATSATSGANCDDGTPNHSAVDGMSCVLNDGNPALSCVLPVGNELAGALAATTLSDFTFVTPNLGNDMHNLCAGYGSSLRNGDDWLRVWLPKFIATPSYHAGKTTIRTSSSLRRCLAVRSVPCR